MWPRPWRVHGPLRAERGACRPRGRRWPRCVQRRAQFRPPHAALCAFKPTRLRKPRRDSSRRVGQRAAPAHARPAGSPKPARLQFDGVKPVQQLRAEASPFAFTPTGEPGEVDQIDHTPRRKADAALRRGQMQPTVRNRTPTDGGGGRRDVAAQALLALLAGSGDAARAQGRDLPRLQNQAELVRQARLAHHRLRESLGVLGT